MYSVVGKRRASTLLTLAGAWPLISEHTLMRGLVALKDFVRHVTIVCCPDDHTVTASVS